MSLDIRYSTNASTVMSAAVMYGSLKSPFYGDDLNYQTKNNDLMLDLLESYQFWYVPVKPRSLGEVFSFTDTNDNLETIKLSHKVVPSVSGAGSLYDDQMYGSIIKNFQILGSVLTGKSFTAPSWLSEHPCRHVTYSGELIAKQSVFQPTTYTSTIYGQTIDIDVIDGSTFRHGYVRSINPLVVEFVPYAFGFKDYNLVTFLQHLAGRVFHHVVTWNGSIFNRTLSDVEYDLSDSMLVIRYNMYVDSVYPYYQQYIWKGTISIPLRGAIRSRQPVLNAEYWTLYGDHHATFLREVSVATPYTGQMVRPFTPEDSNFQVYWTALSRPILNVDAERTICLDIERQTSINSILNNFKMSVEDNWPHIIPSSAFSTVDAFKQAEGSIGPNVLQNLQKLPGIADALPDIQEGVRILGKLLKRDLSLSTLKDILDLSTSTVLKSSFEWRPYYTILTEYIPQLISTMHSLGDIEKNAIGYGSFTFKFTDEFGRKDVTLKTRTKIVMDASPSGLLSALLGFDAMGLLPKTSNLWDLIPFSFVANWFTGIGESLRRLEYTALLAGIPAYYVHTYSLTSPLSLKELDLLEMSSPSSDAASLRLYYRDVSLHSPMVRDSKYGFGIPKDFPPLGVFGSLLYQLIFG